MVRGLGRRGGEGCGFRRGDGGGDIIVKMRDEAVQEGIEGIVAAGSRISGRRG